MKYLSRSVVTFGCAAFFLMVLLAFSTDGKWVGGTFETVTAGGSGGSNSFAVTCPRDTAVTGISGRFGWYVNKLDLRCNPLGSSGASATISAAGSQAGDQSFNLESCSGGKPARGFHGKASLYVDSVGLTCHTNPTPNLQVLAMPDDLVAVNLVNPQTGPSTTAVTPFIQIQWTDRSNFENGYRINIESSGGNRNTPPKSLSIDRPAAAGIGSRQAVTVADLPSGGYIFHVCARFAATDGGDRCTPYASLFQIAAAATCSPVITSSERIGAGTGRVHWTLACNNPTRFDIKLRCGNSPLGTVATTADGTARDETFTFGVGPGVLEVCAVYPGQSEAAFCSAQAPFQCN